MKLNERIKKELFSQNFFSLHQKTNCDWHLIADGFHVWGCGEGDGRKINVKIRRQFFELTEQFINFSKRESTISLIIQLFCVLPDGISVQAIFLEFKNICSPLPVLDKADIKKIYTKLECRILLPFIGKRHNKPLLIHYVFLTFIKRIQWYSAFK